MAGATEPQNAGAVAVVGAPGAGAGSRVRHFLLVTLALAGVGAVGGSAYFFFGGYTRSVPPPSPIGPAVLIDKPTVLVNLPTNDGDRPQEW